MNNTSYYENIPEPETSCWDMFCCRTKFFYTNSEYLQQCNHCQSKMFVNSTRKCDEINKNDSNFDSNAIYAKTEGSIDELEDKYKAQIMERGIEQKTNNPVETQYINRETEPDKYYKNYREAKCMSCQKNFIMNNKNKYYCLWGLYCYKTVDDFKN